MLSEASCSFENCNDVALVGFIKSNGTLVDDAFEAMCSRYMGLISCVASKYRDCCEDYDHNDFLQEGLIGLLCACKSFDPNGGMVFKNYAMLCVENRFRSIRRHRISKSKVPANNIESIDDINSSCEDITEISMQEMLESKEYIKSLYQKIEKALSPLEKDVLGLYLSGYSYKQSADRLSISEKAIDNALYRIRKKLTK